MPEKYLRKITPRRIIGLVFLYGAEFRIVDFGPCLGGSVHPGNVMNLRAEVCVYKDLFYAVREILFFQHSVHELQMLPAPLESAAGFKRMEAVPSYSA